MSILASRIAAFPLIPRETARCYSPSLVLLRICAATEGALRWQHLAGLMQGYGAFLGGVIGAHASGAVGATPVAL